MQMKIFDKGQITMPVGLRKKYHLNIGDFVRIVPEDKWIKLIPVRNERLTDNLFGVFAKYKKEKKEPTSEEIEKATAIGFIEGWKE
ncbi:AbrB/MazE/SpoVT family DNA-binding domain-containing protein [bacterium]|nr:AbrB/MazE/SpoVT family DNA-binding domain-containing protein [bacterium]MBU1752844.1 AbrB/MazE/SpoVT family DNA-binding domain-containing protein [bacterium]